MKLKKKTFFLILYLSGLICAFTIFSVVTMWGQNRISLVQAVPNVTQDPASVMTICVVSIPVYKKDQTSVAVSLCSKPSGGTKGEGA